MRRIEWFFVMFYFITSEVIGQTVRNVRLVDHTSYALKVVERTMKRIEEKQWCNLKVDDVSLFINQTVLSSQLTGEAEFSNGFLVSLRSIDVVQSSVQQVWMPLTVNTTRVEVRANMRMRDASIGFDFLARMLDGDHRSSGIIMYPEIQFPYTITRDMFTDELTVDVTSNLIRTTNVMNFIPVDKVTKVASVLFDWNCTAESVNRWAREVFAPTALDVVHNEVDFPEICYNCSV